MALYRSAYWHKSQLFDVLSWASADRELRLQLAELAGETTDDLGQPE